MIDTTLIPNSDLKNTSLKKKGNTNDIVKNILKADKENDLRFAAFAAQFEPTEQGLQKLWSFVRHQIRYKTDPYGEQHIKFPAALWKLKQGDCKSKTLFITQVLKLLDIEYMIRFTAFKSGADVTHVYPVAILNGQTIIIDSVYQYFNKESSYQRKEDYNMTHIKSIQGLDLSCTNLVEEIQQRKEYIKPKQPINFPEQTTGQALLLTLERKLEIWSVMQDQKNLYEEGINQIRQAMKAGHCGNYKPTGTISDELKPVMERIAFAQTQAGAAIGHGIKGKIIKLLHNTAAAEAKAASITGAGSTCLDKRHWHISVAGSGSSSDPYLYQTTNPLGQCPNWSKDITDRFDAAAADIYYGYGRSTKYRTSWADFKQSYTNVILATLNYGGQNGTPLGIRRIGNNFMHLGYTTQNAIDALDELLDISSPVLSKWLEDTYRADNTRKDGTVGTGLYYDFIDTINDPNINLNSFPTAVVVKKAFQSQYMASCSSFTTVDPLIIRDLAENCFLFDTKAIASPQEFLKAQLNRYQIGLDPVTITLIVSIIAAVAAGASQIITAANGSAKSIDEAKKDLAKFQDLSTANTPDPVDFVTVKTNSGNGGSGGTDTPKDNTGRNLLFGAAALYGAKKAFGNK